MIIQKLTWFVKRLLTRYKKPQKNEEDLARKNPFIAFRQGIEKAKDIPRLKVG